MSEYIDIKGTAFEIKLKALQGDYKMPYRDIEPLRALSAFVNEYKYILEARDVWKTPEEFFRDCGGDCEDFAIVKFHYLKNNFKVQIVVCHHIEEGVDHAVLLVEDRFILDNRTDKVRLYTDFIKIYSVYYRADAVGVMVGGLK